MWREFGYFKDRTLTAVICFLAYAAIAVVLEWAKGHSLDDTPAFIVDAVCLLFATAQWAFMTSRQPYSAAGATWLMRWYRGYRYRPSADWDKGHRALMFDELSRVELTSYREGFARLEVKLVRFVDVHGHAVGIDLVPLQVCPPLRALVEKAMDREGVQVADGIREAMHQPAPRGTRSAGHCVVRGATD